MQLLDSSTRRQLYCYAWKRRKYNFVITRVTRHNSWKYVITCDKNPRIESSINVIIFVFDDTISICYLSQYVRRGGNVLHLIFFFFVAKLISDFEDDRKILQQPTGHAVAYVIKYGLEVHSKHLSGRIRDCCSPEFGFYLQFFTNRQCANILILYLNFNPLWMAVFYALCYTHDVIEIRTKFVIRIPCSFFFRLIWAALFRQAQREVRKEIRFVVNRPRNISISIYYVLLILL